MKIQPAKRSDLPTIKSWLTAAALPVADLTPEHMQGFLIASLDDCAVGMIGLEPYGDIGLLRSLFVDDRARGRGIGGDLVNALEAMARSLQITELWLLTIDADPWFAALGYEYVERDLAPDAIRNTVEFSKLCPGNAVLMMKRL